jgi:hypothetical protein
LTLPTIATALISASPWFWCKFTSLVRLELKISSPGSRDIHLQYYVNSEMNELSLRPRGWRFQDPGGFWRRRCGRRNIRRPPATSSLFVARDAFLLAAAGMRNNATQQAQLLPIRSRIEERLAKAEKGRMGWGKVRRRGCEEMFVRW